MHHMQTRPQKWKKQNTSKNTSIQAHHRSWDPNTGTQIQNHDPKQTTSISTSKKNKPNNKKNKIHHFSKTSNHAVSNIWSLLDRENPSPDSKSQTKATQFTSPAISKQNHRSTKAHKNQQQCTKTSHFYFQKSKNQNPDPKSPDKSNQQHHFQKEKD